VAAVVVQTPAEVQSVPPEAPLSLDLDMFEFPTASSGPIPAPKPATAPLPPAKPTANKFVSVKSEPPPAPPAEPASPPAEREPAERPETKPVRKKQPPKRVAQPHLSDEELERNHDTAVAPNLPQPGAPRVSRHATGSSGVATKRIKASFLAALAEQIDRKKFYPRASRRRGEQGTVVIGFVIERDGDLTGLRVQTSSGFARLDQAALSTLAKVSPFHPIPHSLGLERLPISVPIAFTLFR